MIFVLDSTDLSDHWMDASDALNKILAYDYLKGVPLLILLNKADLIKTSLIDEAKIRLNIEDIEKERKCKVLDSCAYTMSGVLEGIEWIINFDYKDKEFDSFF